MTRRIAWLGGSFDPVHEGHLHIARAALRRFDPERLLLVPARLPPHKRQRVLAPGADRLALLDIACAEDPRLEPCDVELGREGPSYSFHTAVELRARYGDDCELLSIIGADTLADLSSWYRIAELARLVTFCAVTRPGTPLDPSPLRGLLGEAGVRRLEEHLLPIAPHPASSTAIREALGRGEHPSWLPPGVWEEIVRRRLYGAGGGPSMDSAGISTR